MEQEYDFFGARKNPYIQGHSAQEAADDALCERLYQTYLADEDPERDTGKSLEECKAEWGIV